MYPAMDAGRMDQEIPATAITQQEQSKLMACATRIC
ncbi:hypothetical protein SNOG_01625 [Parastagonospora nodorum SN15]|uniref:Uncharacterized protein n=1 Tax=Phaeosphaeria nodorum (strain SN15 / ATCC MYA-4574 / FGSC 10173) TaxID=321614 RepID=Q0V2Y9_PHANO|nr:hypothetical protein SNOG_01625 [Parastagonospora nodorum SN15]EAT91274.1 hypothetical protein SNOG_01625 [Parastagonospora nodorum SN15]